MTGPFPYPILDDLGEWRDLGTITPVYGSWVEFPTAATQGYNTFRITYSGEWYSGWHWAYIRESYFSVDRSLKGSWRRLSPKSEPEILYLYVSDEFQWLNPRRKFELLKAHKYIRTYGGRFNDKVFSIKLEEFAPYPELLAEAQQQTLTSQTISLIAQEVIRLLPPSN